jgi:hypothetical protein
LNRPQ